jgi:hypothetical protein
VRLGLLLRGQLAGEHQPGPLAPATNIAALQTDIPLNDKNGFQRQKIPSLVKTPFINKTYIQD